MQMIKNYILLAIIVGFSNPSLIAQEEVNEYNLTGVTNIVLALNRLESKKVKSTTTADVLYENYGFSKAANLYKAGNVSESVDKTVWSKLGNAARLNANYDEAVYWYEKVVSDGPVPKDLLYYAQALQAIGNCEEAVKWFKLYNDSPAVEKISFISNCSDVEGFYDFEEVSMISISSLNSKYLDFSARPYKDGIVFTSNRGANKFSKLIDNWTSNNFTDLYFSKKTGDTYSKPNVLKGGVNGKFHDGVAAITKEGEMMYFTRNNKSKISGKKVKRLKIYSVSKDAEKWSEAKELSFNSNDFSSCHPTITEGGDTMYFSSNRPGGFGGMDIYMVTKLDNSWTSPINMGPSINTAGNEVFPFITNEGDIAFSSNGHPGFGGLDLYVARKSVKTNQWDRMVNAGKPFNSTKDDFGFYMDLENTSGYISSSRVGQTNNDDIYAWSSDSPVDFFPELSFEQSFCIVEAGTKTPLKNASVDIMQNDGKDINQAKLKTDEKGMFSLTVWPQTILAMDLAMTGFKDNKENWSSTLTNAEVSECVYLEMKKIDEVAIMGIIVDANNRPINKADITIVNKCTKKTQKLKSNAQGKFNMNVPCGCDYSIVGSKVDFLNNTELIKTAIMDCTKTKEIKLELKKPAPVVVAPTPTFKDKPIKVGAIIALPNINYDFNKANIRPDAAVELDKVGELLIKYPSLSIELGAHTDARGSADYNMMLSSSRAIAAIQYLISKGISKDRISSKGYGETQLINSCSDNVKCSEIEHESNRRIEIKVVEF